MNLRVKMSSINKFKLELEAFQNLVDIKFYVRVKRGIPHFSKLWSWYLFWY